MNAISAPALTDSTAQPAPRAAGGSGLSSDFTTFLRMLTTQLQNQDPMNPIESSDYAVQLATFSGVEQQVQTNQLLQSLVAQLGAGGLAQYAGWVGKQALVTEPVAFTGSPVTLNPMPDGKADSAILVVLDDQNREAARLDLPVGGGPMIWDGTDASGNALPAGLYAFRVESMAAGELIASSRAPAYGSIAEVRMLASGPMLILLGGSEVDPDAVSGLRVPDE